MLSLLEKGRLDKHKLFMAVELLWNTRCATTRHLKLAAQNGWSHVVQPILATGVPITKGVVKAAILGCCPEQNRMEVLDMLLGAGVSKIPDCMEWAAGAGQYGMVQWLWRKGFPWGRALERATLMHDENMVRWMLGVHDLPGELKNEALWHAVRARNEEIVEMLLAAGAEASERVWAKAEASDKTDRLIADWHYPMVRILQRYGSRPKKTKEETKWTAAARERALLGK